MGADELKELQATASCASGAGADIPGGRVEDPRPRREERLDEGAAPGLQGTLADELSHGEVENAEAEGAERRSPRPRPPCRRGAGEEVRQGAADEVAVARLPARPGGSRSGRGRRGRGRRRRCRQARIASAVRSRSEMWRIVAPGWQAERSWTWGRMAVVAKEISGQARKISSRLGRRPGLDLRRPGRSRRLAANRRARVAVEIEEHRSGQVRGARRAGSGGSRG